MRCRKAEVGAQPMTDVVAIEREACMAKVVQPALQLACERGLSRCGEACEPDCERILSVQPCAIVSGNPARVPGNVSAATRKDVRRIQTNSTPFAQVLANLMQLSIVAECFRSLAWASQRHALLLVRMTNEGTPTPDRAGYGVAAALRLSRADESRRPERPCSRIP
jgi:hypothetical protein